MNQTTYTTRYLTIAGRRTQVSLRGSLNGTQSLTQVVVIRGQRYSITFYASSSIVRAI